MRNNLNKLLISEAVRKLLPEEVIEAIDKRITEPVFYDDIEYDPDHTIYGTYECPNCGHEYDAYDDGILKYCSECGKKFSWYEVNKEVTERLCPYFDGHEERCSMALKFEDCSRAKEEMTKEVK